MVKDLHALTGYISILKRHARHVQRTNNFNETLFSIVRKNYIETVDNFKYEFNLFKDAIVYRTKLLVDTKAEQFKKVSDVLHKEQGDTNMVIGQSLDLAFNMRDNIWPDIQSKLFTTLPNSHGSSEKYTMCIDASREHSLPADFFEIPLGLGKIEGCSPSPPPPVVAPMRKSFFHRVNNYLV